MRNDFSRHTRVSFMRHKSVIYLLSCSKPSTHVLRAYLYVSPVLGYKVHEYLLRFRKYDWLWKDDKDVQYKQFVASNPAISDYEVRYRICRSEDVVVHFRMYAVAMTRRQSIKVVTESSHGRQFQYPSNA